jgi:hypothetical protein
MIMKTTFVFNRLGNIQACIGAVFGKGGRTIAEIQVCMHAEITRCGELDVLSPTLDACDG